MSLAMMDRTSTPVSHLYESEVEQEETNLHDRSAIAAPSVVSPFRPPKVMPSSDTWLFLHCGLKDGGRDCILAALGNPIFLKNPEPDGLNIVDAKLVEASYVAETDWDIVQDSTQPGILEPRGESKADDNDEPAELASTPDVIGPESEFVNQPVDTGGPHSEAAAVVEKFIQPSSPQSGAPPRSVIRRPNGPLIVLSNSVLLRVPDKFLGAVGKELGSEGIFPGTMAAEVPEKEPSLSIRETVQSGETKRDCGQIVPVSAPKRQLRMIKIPWYRDVDKKQSSSCIISPTCKECPDGLADERSAMQFGYDKFSTETESATDNLEQLKVKKVLNVQMNCSVDDEACARSGHKRNGSPRTIKGLL